MSGRIELVETKENVKKKNATKENQKQKQKQNVKKRSNNKQERIKLVETKAKQNINMSNKRSGQQRHDRIDKKKVRFRKKIRKRYYHLTNDERSFKRNHYRYIQSNMNMEYRKYRKELQLERQQDL